MRRLSYNPQMSDDVFRNILARRYPAVSSSDLFEAWTRASRPLPRVTELIMANWELDFHWWPEACWSDPGRETGTAKLSNDGYASVIKKRPVHLVLVNASGRYDTQLSNVDICRWVSGDVTVDLQTVTLPPGMQPGTYRLALWLPDASASLQHRPEYSIRLANADIWDAANGYNVLSDSVIVQ